MHATNGAITVVGGGIAGLYCCYRLAQQGRRVVLYEYLDRLGGRIESWKIDHELYADFGPMRIEPDCQPLLGRLLDDLEFRYKPLAEAQNGDLIDFSEYRAAESAGTTPRLSELDAQYTNALATLRDGLLGVCMSTKRSLWGSAARRELRLMADAHPDISRRPQRFEDFLATLTTDDFDSLRRHGEFHGTPLWNMGFWNLLSDVLPHEAITRMRDFGTFYHLLGDNPNAVEWTIFWLRALATSPHLRGLKGGMAQIVDRLAHRLQTPPLSKYVSIKSRMKLVHVAPAPRQRLRLRFEDADKKIINVSTDRVILALPKRPLEHLSQCLHAIEGDIDAVFGFPLIKCFFVIDDPWWTENREANEFATVAPTRELHWWLRSDGKRGVVMIYADRPAAHFWADYLPRNREQRKPLLWRGAKSNKRLAQKFKQYVLANLVQPDEYSDRNLRECGIRDWSREPFGGGAHAWRPGRKSWEVMRRLEQFALVPGGPRNVHVCGEAYSDYQGFIEGALRSAASVLRRIGVKP